MLSFLYKVYQFCIVLPLGLLLTGLSSIAIALLSVCGFPVFAAKYLGGFWAWAMLRMLLIPVTVEGKEHVDPKQSYVFVANHQGAFDIFGIYGYLRHEFKWMMKKSLGDIPLVGMACRKAGFIFVDKSSRRAILQTMTDAKKALTGGASLCVFPEGARTFTGHMGVFRSGAFQLANTLQLPVVPITIDGSFDILPRMRGFNFVNWHPLRIVIHKPIAPEGKGPEHVRHAMDESYRIIMSALPERHQGFVENPDQLRRQVRHHTPVFFKPYNGGTAESGPAYFMPMPLDTDTRSADIPTTAGRVRTPTMPGNPEKW